MLDGDFGDDNIFVSESNGRSINEFTMLILGLVSMFKILKFDAA